MTHRDEVRLHLPGALEGDHRAVQRLLTAFRPLVAKYCRARIGGNGGTFRIADEIAQRACLAVLGELPRYREQSRPFLAFVYGITAGVVDDAGVTNHHPLDRLPAPQRDVVILRTVAGLSAEETAEAMSMTPAGVRLAQHKALEALRSTMRPESGTG